jgi:5'-3' exonuclease
MQIVTDEEPAVRLLYVGRGLAKAELLGPAEVAEKYGVPRARAGAAYAEMAMLRGDPSDGLPGVPGVGAKTAATIVGRYDTWADLLAAVADPSDARMSPNVRSKLAKATDYLAVVEPVVRVAQDADVVLDRPDTLPVEPADGARLLELVERWGIASSVERLLQALQTAAKSR